MDPKEQFYRDFHLQVAAINESIGRLGAAAVGSERKRATDGVLASISKLSHDVADAAESIPAYDQRLYAEAVKTLTDRLNSELARSAPKARFRFKRSAKPNAAPAEADPRLLRGIGSVAADDDDSSKQAQVASGEAAPAAKDYNAEIAAGSARLRTPSFSAARDIAIAGHAGLHIVLPLSAAQATASGSLTDLAGCVVDLSVPTAAPSSAFFSLVLKNIDRSLVVAGHVRGPVHITGLRDCVVVVASRQVRIHECARVDLYLHSGSRPIIEDCHAMRFAPLPACYMNETDKTTANQWDQVDDFKWLKADHSPNWSVLPEAERLPEAVWTGAVAGASGLETEAVLQAVGIGKA